jgi:hypothetical protein
MEQNVRPEPEEDLSELTPEEAVQAKAAGAWTRHLARTLKTCRLYDRFNPTVLRFREDLATSLTRYLREHGALTLTFTSSDVLWGRTSLYPAKSRDDNLALPFFRDGIRSITFEPGIPSRELEALVDIVLQLTSRSATDDDMVTRIWEAALEHIELECVSVVGDIETGGGEAPGEGATLAPWPHPAPGGAGGFPAGASPPAVQLPEGIASALGPAGAGGVAGLDLPEGGDANAIDIQAPDAPTRSDDRIIGAPTRDFERAFSELDARSSAELTRFRLESEAEAAQPLEHAVLDVLTDCLYVSSTTNDRSEIGRYIPRVLRESIGLGEWSEAKRCLGLLEVCGGPEWSLEGFTTELIQPTSIPSRQAISRVDQQEGAELDAFLDFGRMLGPAVFDWWMHVVAESQHQRVRRAVCQAISILISDNPERLAPWLADERWYVVRNAVSILGNIGGSQTVGLLRPVARHADRRVRREVVNALAHADLAAARPLLLEMLPDARGQIFCWLLRHLAGKRDAEVANTALGLMREENFLERPVEERRAIYMTLGATGDDQVLPVLEQELHAGGWFSKVFDLHRQEVARCIARLGTPAAREVLERGSHSLKPQLRKACLDALSGGSTNG